MATWAIGDVHGCWASLAALLDRIELDRGSDRLWLVGDLVNRGPGSLAVLRWARATAEAIGERFVAVLGNHDVHFLARHHGLAAARPRDTLDELLAAPDAAELAAWLGARPFLHRDGERVLVHAGLLPEWTVADAEDHARRVAARMAEPAERRRLLAPDGDGGPRPEDRRALDGFLKLRTVTVDGTLCDWNGPPAEAPAECIPWFQAPGRRHAAGEVVFGHWAAMGLRLERHLLALDTACVWGGSLTAIRLEDRRVVQQPSLDATPRR